MKISKKEWQKVEGMARQLAFSPNFKSRKYKLHKRRFFAYFSKLEEKYGKDPNILATRADFYDSTHKANILLAEAYKIASKQHDYKNCTLISSSLAFKYIMICEDISCGKHWLEILKKDLKRFYDEYTSQEYKELKTELENLTKLVPQKKEQDIGKHKNK